MLSDFQNLSHYEIEVGFHSLVRNFISEKGILSIDLLINRINKGDPSKIGEQFILLGKLICLAHEGRIKQALCLTEDEDETSTYDQLKAVVASRRALETVILNCQKQLLEYIDPVLAYQAGHGEIGRNAQPFLRRLMPENYGGKFDTDNDSIMPILEKMAQEEVKTVEQAKKHREKITRLYSKMKMLDRSRGALNALERMLNHGWFNEEDYNKELEQVKNSISTIEKTLQNKQERYVLYKKERS